MNNKTLVNSIDQYMIEHKPHLGKICTQCGYKYEEHSTILKVCPDYDTENFDYEAEEKRFKEFLNCKKCKFYYIIPTCVLETPEMFICKNRRKLYEQNKNTFCLDFERKDN
jgi:predicted  nucleic acid-binding Zn-ribbon protein